MTNDEAGAKKYLPYRNTAGNPLTGTPHGATKEHNKYLVQIEYDSGKQFVDKRGKSYTQVEKASRE